MVGDVAVLWWGVTPAWLIEQSTNSALSWVVVAILVGFFADTPRTGAIAGLTVLLSADVSYHALSFVWGPRAGSSSLAYAALAWGILAVAAGLLGGASGSQIGEREGPWVLAGSALLGGTLLVAPVAGAFKEVLHLLPSGTVAFPAVSDIVWLAAGLAVAAGWPRGLRNRLVALACAALIAACFGGYHALTIYREHQLMLGM